MGTGFRPCAHASPATIPRLSDVDPRCSTAVAKISSIVRRGPATAINLRLRMTANVKRDLIRAMRHSDWADAGQGWQGKETSLRLHGWSRHRRIILLRRKLAHGVAISNRSDPAQPLLSFGEVEADKELWEYAALVTSLKHEILTLGQLYRDRADCDIDQAWRLSRINGWVGSTCNEAFCVEHHGSVFSPVRIRAAARQAIAGQRGHAVPAPRRGVRQARCRQDWPASCRATPDIARGSL
jgi:hypothetical protein